MTKREEIIEQLTKDMSSRSKKKLIDFWNGKGQLTGPEYIEYYKKIAEFEHLLRVNEGIDKRLDDYLKESKRAYMKSF